ncbi:uncharacterized protein LOC125474746 [Pyrus x bretschneideri]|uniref:uncharacterized protein LOC125474746 n=1 Tax=Pyrus x bretschneideri TaxID=225117 RepID=UPI00202EA691|nr:uncharacterized protein LOC125474746 [Pyrus x bretschneideri]
MSTIFKSHGIWDLVENGLEISKSNGKKVEDEGSSDSEKTSLSDELMKDTKALGIIQGAVSDDIYPRISNDKTSNGAWDILHQEFHSNKQLVNQMKGFGEDLPNERLVQKLLISLTKEFDLVCYVIEQTKDIETIEVQKVITALSIEGSTDRAFVNPTLPRGMDPVSNMINEENLICLKGNANTVTSYTMVSAGLNGSQGAMDAIDLVILSNDYDQPNKVEKLANFANQVSESATMFYARHSATIGRNMNIWYVDSACSNHMISHESLLIYVDKTVKCILKMGIRDLVQLTCNGTLVIEMKGVTRYIKEVMIVLGLDANLLSVGHMVEHGYWLVFGDFMVNIYGDRQMEDLIASVPMEGNRFFP